LPKLTFQVIRRTIATLAKVKGHVKDIQGMMRHSRLATTTEVYMQSLEEGVRSTVNSIQEELSGTGTSGSNPPAATMPGFSSSMPNAATIVPGREGPAREKQDQSAKPVCWVVLEFATRMRKSQGSEELLND
jgi:hypothetical protein